MFSLKNMAVDHVSEKLEPQTANVAARTRSRDFPGLAVLGSRYCSKSSLLKASNGSASRLRETRTAKVTT